MHSEKSAQYSVISCEKDALCNEQTIIVIIKQTNKNVYRVKKKVEVLKPPSEENVKSLV